jgi:hypothetical protein
VFVFKHVTVPVGLLLLLLVVCLCRFECPAGGIYPFWWPRKVE